MDIIDQPSVRPVAIVTGASSGIGLEYARELCSRGYDVVMVSNEEERLTRCAGELSQTYEVQTWPLYMDLSLPDAAEHLHGFCVALGLQVEVLVNNAGIVDKHRPITECTDEWWNEIIAIDQSSLFYMMKDTIPHMMASGKGSIINVSSIGGVFGIYELLPAFLVGLVLMVIVSLCTKAPSKEITDEFDRVKAMGKAK